MLCADPEESQERVRRSYSVRPNLDIYLTNLLTTGQRRSEPAPATEAKEEGYLRGVVRDEWRHCDERGGHEVKAADECAMAIE